MRVVKLMSLLVPVLAAEIPGGLSAQKAATILVLDVPVELRMLTPEVARAFLECTIGVHRDETPPDYTLYGAVARTELGIATHTTGGQVSEVARVDFGRDAVHALPGGSVGAGQYACSVILRTGTGEEAPTLTGMLPNHVTPAHVQNFGPEPPAWSQMISYQDALVVGSVQTLTPWDPLRLQGDLPTQIHEMMWEAWTGCTYQPLLKDPTANCVLPKDR